MNQIGFKNFRKFKELAPLDLGPITMFVGENNAGKSTVVKALLTVLDFIQTRVSSLENDSWLNINYYFNKSYYTHLGTFDRSRYNKAGENDPITFTFLSDNRCYEIEVEKSDNESDVYGRVSRIKVTLLPFNIDVTFSLKSDRSINIVFHAKPYPGYASNDMAFSEAQKLIKKYFSGLTKDIEIETTIISELKFASEYVIDGLLLSFQERIKATLNNLSSKTLSKSEDGIFGLSKDAEDFLIKKKAIFSSLYFKSDRQRQMNVEYIYAHSVTQTILFSSKDTNDYHVKTVHEFANYSIGWDNPIRDFIQRGMDMFNIGFDFKIESVGGEAHLVKIINRDGSEVNLADKGMGSIQLMILLFRIATKMAEAGVTYGRKEVNSLLIIEEPEQNLHPQLQSKLADFFYKLNKDYGFRFIIETHSEYLIRKSQVIVGQGYKGSNIFDNPFKVIYFPADGLSPYDMLYREDGKFSNEFGTGFFDEASNLIFDIL